MALSLHEQRILSGIERELSGDPSLRALSAFAVPEAAPGTEQAEAACEREPEPEPAREDEGGYIIRDEDEGESPRRPGGSRMRVLLGTLLVLLGPAMLVPALLTGISLLVIPVLVTPLLTVVILVAARRRRDSGA